MNRLQANLLLVVVAMIWGSGFVVQQVGTGELGTIGFTGIRFLLGAVVVFPFAFYQYRQKKSSGWQLSPSLGAAMIFVGLVLFIAASLQQYGIFYTTVTNSGFLTGLYVPLVPLLSLLFFRKRIHLSVWPASLSCFVGIWLLSGAQEFVFAKGDWWVMASSLFWALHVIVVGIVAQKTQMPLVVAGVQFAVCGVLGVFAGVIVERVSLDQLTAAWQGICYSGILSVGVAFTLQVVGQRYTAPADAAIILSSESVFAACCGILFLGERLELIQAVGALVIFLSVIAVEVLPLAALRVRK